MPPKRLVLLFDTRDAGETGGAAWFGRFADHIRDLLSVVRIQSFRECSQKVHRPLLVSLYAIQRNDDVVAVVTEALFSATKATTTTAAASHNGSDGCAAVFQALAAMTKSAQAAASAPALSTGQTDRMLPVTRFLYELHHQCSALLPAAHAGDCVAVIGSNFIPYGHVFEGLSQVCTAGLLFDVHCVIADSSAVCLTNVSLSVRVHLWRCSRSPTESRMALEMGMCRWLLASEKGLRTPCRVRCGYLSFSAVAERPFIAQLSSSASVADFPAIQQACPGMVLCGATPVHSPFELTRHTSQTVTVLTLSAVVAPHQVDDTWLFGSAWVISIPPESSSQEAAVCAALFHALRGDALIFSTTQPHLDAPDTMALPRSTFVGYFLDHTRLCVRQAIPAELRAACVTSAEGATNATTSRRDRDAPDPALVARAAQVRQEIVVESNAMSVDELLSGGVASAAAQLRADAQFCLRLDR